MGSYDFKLKDGLDNWCTVQMETEFPGDEFFGPQYLMSGDILNRIVDLARYKKLADVASLLGQTDWRHAGKYGPQILELVNIYVLRVVGGIIVNNLSVLVDRPLCTVLMVVLQCHCNKYLMDVVDVIVNDC